MPIGPMPDSRSSRDFVPSYQSIPAHRLNLCGHGRRWTVSGVHVVRLTSMSAMPGRSIELKE